MNNTQQGHGFFRKSKAYGLVCAIALAGAFTLATSQVSADQVTTQATTQTVTQNQAETVTSTQLDKAVDTAKIVGVAVTTTAAVNHATTTDAQADLSNQTQTVKDVTAKAQANTQAIKNASAENAKIDAENKAEAERIAQQNKAGQEAVDARNKAKQQAQDDQKSKIDAENKAEAERINKLNAEAQANVDNQNKIARLKADQTNAQLKANYEKAKLAYEKAVEDRKNLVAYDVTFDGFGKSETATGFGQKTADVVTVDKDGNFVISEPQFDTDGTFGHTKVTGKFNYTVNFDEKTQSAVVTITGVQLNSWQLDITRKTTAVNHDITATYKDLAGNVLYTTKYDGLQSIGAQTINKSFAFNKVITLADGQSSDELMFLKTEPRWLVSAPSSLYAKLTYKTAPLPEKPIEPKMVTPDLKNYTPVPFVPKDYKPQPITPETFTPEKFTPAQPKVKPHVAIPEKVNYSVSVHPVLVPAANPSKAVIDEAGQSVNGKTVLPNATLDYVAKQNFSQYKGIKASAEAIAKGFAFVDQPNEALGELTVKSIKASNGDDVSSLLEMRHVLSKDTLDQKLQSLIKEAGISPVGEFYMWIAKDPQAFYKAYVQKGLDITYNLSFKVKKEFTKGQIQNGVAQIDFGNGYTGNIVVNDLTTPEVHKDVLDKEDGKSINNGTVKLGDEVTYKLEGWVVPANRGYDLFEYKFVDQLQRTHDLYLRDKVVAKVDVTLKDGTVIKKGTNLGEYTETVYNQTTGRYELAFKKEFLAKVSRESEFGADDFIVVKRIKAGDVYNTADLYVNGYKVKSETVVTHTPEKPKPVEPKKGVPTTPAKGLPQTGEAGMSSLTAIGAIILSALGFAGVKKRKEN